MPSTLLKHFMDSVDHKSWLDLLNVVAAFRRSEKVASARPPSKVHLHLMPNRFGRDSMLKNNQGLGKCPCKALSRCEEAF